MCGFGKATDKYSHGKLYPSFVFKSLWQLAKKGIANNQAEELYVFNGGSFLNEREIPLNFQNYLCRQVSRHHNLKLLMLESRCEYLSLERIESLSGAVKPKTLMLGLGLESQDDFIRNTLIKKGLNKKFFETKVRLLKDAGIRVMVYVFLKPLGLSEKQAYEECKKTINYALSVGVDEIELSSAFIQANTKMAQVYQRGDFRPPWLWTIMNLVQEIKENHWPVSIGGFEDEPPPLAIPSNCANCSKDIYEILEEFRTTRILRKAPDCACLKDWKRLF